MLRKHLGADKTGHRRITMSKQVLFIFLLPIFIWMLVGAYKEFKRDFQIESDRDLIFRILWLVGLAFAVATSLMMVLFDSSIALSLKNW